MYIIIIFFLAKMQDFSLSQALIEGECFVKTVHCNSSTSTIVSFLYKDKYEFPVYSMSTLILQDSLACSCDGRAGSGEGSTRGGKGSLSRRETPTSGAQRFKLG